MAINKRGVPITPEMVADWIGPGGYTDINSKNCLCFPYGGEGFAFIVFNDDGEVMHFATTAWSDDLSPRPRKFCPEYKSIPFPPDIAARFQRHRLMVEPEFTLDEMAQAEELVGRRG